MKESAQGTGFTGLRGRIFGKKSGCDTESCTEKISVPEHQYDDIMSSISGRFRDEEISGERSIARMALIVCLLALAYSVTVFFGMSEPLGTALGVTSIFYASYYALDLYLLRRGLYRGWMKYVSCTLEVSAPTVVAVLDTLHVSAEYALTSSPPYIYFIAIAGSVLRFNRSLCLYAGGLAAIESAAVFLWAGARFTAQPGDLLPSLSPLIYFQRSGYIFCAGLVAASICKTARQLVNSVGMSVGRMHYLHRMFGKFVSDEVVRKIEREGLSTAGELREVTILCSDVRGFTAYSERKPPREVVAFINALFEKQCAVIERHGGRVDKFMGDGLLAIFGAPVELENHALSAARAALEIASIRTVELPSAAAPVSLGVALHTGDALIGNIGSTGRLEYTAMGDAVNTAFRIEGLNARFGTSLLMSGHTHRALGDAATAKKLSSVKVKGKEDIISLYELNGLNSRA